MSNSSKIRHVLESREGIGTVCKVSVINALNMNLNSHLQMVSFIELGCADENPTNAVPDEDIGSLNVVSADLPDELILARIMRYLISIGEQVEEEQF